MIGRVILYCRNVAQRYCVSSLSVWILFSLRGSKQRITSISCLIQLSMYPLPEVPGEEPLQIRAARHLRELCAPLLKAWAG